MADDCGAVADGDAVMAQSPVTTHQFGGVPDNPQSRIDGKPDSNRSRKPVKVLTAQVALKGGWSKTKHVVDTMTVSHDNGAKEQFARVSTSFQWLRCIVTDNQERGRMRFSKVLKVCREKLDAPDEPEPEAVVTASNAPSGADVGDADPMDALAETDQPPKPKKDQKKKQTSRAMGAVRTIQMPQSPGNDTVVGVRFYVQSRKTKPCLWISVDNLAWFVEYAISETTSLGVEDCDPIQDPCVANSAVAEFRITWDFAAHAYNAAILQGDHAGMTRSMSPSELGPSRLVIARRSLGVGLTMKEATKAFLAAWCEAVKRNAVDEFEQTWSACGAVSSSTATETDTTDSCPTDADVAIA